MRECGSTGGQDRRAQGLSVRTCVRERRSRGPGLAHGREAAKTEGHAVSRDEVGMLGGLPK